jgi:hypothetical protein
MRRLRAGFVLLLACAAPVLAAEKLAPLDAEFLEYLASFGSDEENWVLFADDEEPATQPPPAKEPPAQQPQAKSDGSKPEAAAKPAEKR